MRICLRCDGTRWVCESHPDTPWEDSPRACSCGAAGAPCPACNKAADGEVPAMPKGFEAEVVRDFDPILDAPGDLEEEPDAPADPSRKPH
jgi:hypothetical protein